MEGHDEKNKRTTFRSTGNMKQTKAETKKGKKKPRRKVES